MIWKAIRWNLYEILTHQGEKELQYFSTLFHKRYDLKKKKKKINLKHLSF